MAVPPCPTPSSTTLNQPGDDEPHPLPGPYLFYQRDLPIEESTVLPPGYWWTMWRPTWGDLWPREVTDLKNRLKFIFRTAIYFLGLFAGDECGALLILRGTHLAHYSQFSPRYWRFPAMRAGDLQIGDTWTDPADRGRGLALFALEHVIAAHYRPGRKFWYVVAASNAASIRVVQKAGFKLVGTGAWVKPLGIKLTSAYVMKEARVIKEEAGAPPSAIQHG